MLLIATFKTEDRAAAEQLVGNVHPRPHYEYESPEGFKIAMKDVTPEEAERIFKGLEFTHFTYSNIVWNCRTCGHEVLSKDPPRIEWTDGHKCQFVINWTFSVAE